VSDRPKGVVVYRSPVNPIAEEAKKHQRQLQRQRQEARAARADRPVPNRIAYADTAFKDRYDANGKWLGGKVPRCRKCDGLLHPEENHRCPGFIARYPTAQRSHEERVAMERASWDDWDDDQYDRTTPEDIPLEAETDETKDQVVIEGMTEEEWLIKKFGYLP
jgi:hypothetical protein